MRFRLARRLPGFAALAALAVVAGPGPAAASGAWSTYIRAYTYYDLLAEGDTVWCTTGEAGLLRFQRRDSSFVSITREPSGLASNHLSALLRDRPGRLWVGTLGAGASRLSADGKKWDLVNRFDGLPSDSVTSFAARGDTLLIGTTRGIALWNGVEIAGALPDGFNPSPFTNGSDWITGIVIHGESVWVSTQLGVYQSRFSQGLTNWIPQTVADFIDEGPFQGIAADDTTVIALTSTGTPFKHAFDNPGQWSFATGIAGGGTIPNDAVRIYQDHGKILLTTEEGLFVWDPRNGWLRLTNQFISDRTDDEHSFAFGVDKQGRYLAADRDGLRERVGNPDLWTARVPPGPPGNNILNVAVDGKKSVWVNTFSEGIGRLSGGEWRLYPFTGDPCSVGCDSTFYTSGFAFALLVDGRDKKWFGLWGSSVDVFDDSLATPVVTHNRYLPPPEQHALHTAAWASASDPDGGRWFGLDTYNSDFPPLGLDYYDAAGTFIAGFSPDSSTVRGGKIHALTVDRSGRLWVGYTGQGIDIFDIHGRARPDTLYAPLTVLGSERYDVQGLVAHGDTVWALTTSELIAYKRATATRIVSYAIPAAPGQLSVNPLAVARDGTVWVGSVNGIRVVEPDGSTHDFDTGNSPLADLEVRAIRVDDATGAVWIGTTRGLNRYDPGYRPPAPPAVPELKIKIYPNPAWLSSIGIGIKLDGNATSYFGEVYDLQGRRLHKFSGVGNQGVVWDGHTDQGDLARPGIYFFRIESGGKTTTSRVILLR
jgi:ligand-binding sensor domain-containing protein